jgi:hypothetical protein
MARLCDRLSRAFNLSKYLSPLQKSIMPLSQPPQAHLTPAGTSNVEANQPRRHDPMRMGKFRSQLLAYLSWKLIFWSPKPRKRTMPRKPDRLLAYEAATSAVLCVQGASVSAFRAHCLAISASVAYSLAVRWK